MTNEGGNDGRRVAVLFDAENCGPSAVEGILRHASTLGRVTIRRAYVGHDLIGSGKWRTGPYARHGVSPVYVPSTSVGKNACDLALAVAAMDIAHLRLADVVCVASSDGDFAVLAHRLRELGLTVVGYGAEHAPVAWAGACDAFVDTREAGLHAPTSATEHAAKLPVAKRSADKAPVLAALKAHLAAGGRRTVGDFGQSLKTVDPNFNPKDYGHRTLHKLLESLEGVTVVRHGPHSTLDMAPEAAVGTAAEIDGPEESARAHEGEEETIPKSVTVEAGDTQGLASVDAVRIAREEIAANPGMTDRGLWMAVRNRAGVSRLSDLGISSIGHLGAQARLAPDRAAA